MLPQTSCFHLCNPQAYRAAMQTQWSWILQLCHCVEQHLKENAVYFDVSYAAVFNATDFMTHVRLTGMLLLSLQFFSEAKESLDYLKSLQDAIHRKYSCDRSSSLHRLEDLIQESMVSSHPHNQVMQLFGVGALGDLKN